MHYFFSLERGILNLHGCKEYPQAIFKINISVSPLAFLLINIQSIENFIIVIDYMIDTNINLNTIISAEKKTILHWIFAGDKFNAQMLNYLYQRVPQLDIWCEDETGRSPLFHAMYYMYYGNENEESPKLFELLQVIKSYESSHSRTKIITEYTEYTDYYKHDQLIQTINKYAMDPNQSTIHALIGLCGELFPSIDPINLTQDICNQFYSSKYFQCNPDQVPLIKLIPEQFPRKPCRLWRNQFTGCEFTRT
jgi:hypothetical protein